MKIAVLNFPHAVMSSVIGPFDILGKSNAFLDSFFPDNDYPRIEVSVLQSRPSINEESSLTEFPQVITDKSLKNDVVYDLIIIPAMNFDKITTVLEKEESTIHWLKWQHTEGAEIASICLGAFLLAATGLLDGKTATTHWIGAPMFRKMYPSVDLLDDKIIVDNNRIYSSGGAFSFTSLMIYLVEKFFDHQAAMLISKVFLIHVHDSRQQSYAIMHHQKSHGDKEIAAVQEYIEDFYMKRLSNEQMAANVNMSVRTLMRRFKKATGNTPYEYVQRMRIEAAKKMFENTDAGIEQASLQIGYEDFSAFRKVFKRIVGITPMDYKRKYGKTFLPDFVNIT